MAHNTPLDSRHQTCARTSLPRRRRRGIEPRRRRAGWKAGAPSEPRDGETAKIASAGFPSETRISELDELSAIGHQ
jgi:hypothetical protein